MEDYRTTLYKKASRRLPDFPKRSEDFYVAILPPHKTVRHCDEKDFLWLKARGVRCGMYDFEHQRLINLVQKNTIGQIKKVHIKRTGIEIDLRDGTDVPADDLQLRYLSRFHGDVLAFWTIETGKKRALAENRSGGNVIRGSLLGLEEGDRENCLAGMTFVFTGILPTLDRKSAENLVKLYGGKVTTAPSRATTFAVLGPDVLPSKLEKIRDLCIKTLDEKGFFDLIRQSVCKSTGPKMAEHNSFGPIRGSANRSLKLPKRLTDLIETVQNHLTSLSKSHPRSKIEMVPSEARLQLLCQDCPEYKCYVYGRAMLTETLASLGAHLKSTRHIKQNRLRLQTEIDAESESIYGDTGQSKGEATLASSGQDENEMMMDGASTETRVQAFLKRFPAQLADNLEIPLINGVPSMVFCRQCPDFRSTFSTLFPDILHVSNHLDSGVHRSTASKIVHRKRAPARPKMPRHEIIRDLAPTPNSYNDTPDDLMDLPDFEEIIAEEGCGKLPFSPASAAEWDKELQKTWPQARIVPSTVSFCDSFTIEIFKCLDCDEDLHASYMNPDNKRATRLRQVGCHVKLMAHRKRVEERLAEEERPTSKSTELSPTTPRPTPSLMTTEPWATILSSIQEKYPDDDLTPSRFWITSAGKQTQSFRCSDCSEEIVCDVTTFKAPALSQLRYHLMISDHRVRVSRRLGRV